jgi:hypothetical protein
MDCHQCIEDVECDIDGLAVAQVTFAGNILVE